MKISDIPKKLQIKRPIFKNKSKGGLRILFAESMKKSHKNIQTNTTRSKAWTWKQKNRRHRGKGFGMLAASVGVPLLMSLMNKL